MKRSLHFRSRGFTLLEIMLVVMIIALLAGAAIYSMGDSIGFAGSTRVKSDINLLTTSLMVYQASNGFYPTTEQGLKALVEKPEGEPKPRNWRQLMKQVPVDPWQHPYQYVQPGVHNPSNYDLFSAGKDRKVGTPDDEGNWKTE